MLLKMDLEVENESFWLQWAGHNPVLWTVVTVMLTTLVLHVLVEYQQRKKRPPGPWGWPIVGNYPVLMTELPHRTLQKVAAKYGGLMYLQLGAVPCLVLSSAEAAKNLCRAHESTFSDRPQSLVTEILTGGSIKDLSSLAFAPYGPRWRHLRRLCNTELFSPAIHASHERVREEEVRNMMKVLLDEFQQTEPIHVKGWLNGVLANIMTKMLMNKRYFGSGVENRQEKEAFEKMMDSSFNAFGAFIIGDFLPYFSFISKWQWVPKLEVLRKSRGAVVAKMFDVEKHKELASIRGENDNYVPDFVDVLLRKPLDDGKPLTDRDILSMLVGMLNAGTDSSATTVEWAMSELMVHPDIRKQAQEELDTVVGNERLVQESDIPNLPFLQAIVKETFRLHPAGPLLVPRQSHEPCEVSGCHIPAHTRLIVNVFAIHRDPNVYEHPDEFKPSRFLDHPEVNHLSGRDYYQLIPFGFGRRMCPGNVLGNVMVSLTLAHLLHAFDWFLPAGENVENFDMSEVFGLVAFKKKRLYLNIKHRSPAYLY